MQEHKSFLIRDLLGDVLSERVHGEFEKMEYFCIVVVRLDIRGSAERYIWNFFCDKCAPISVSFNGWQVSRFLLSKNRRKTR